MEGAIRVLVAVIAVAALSSTWLLAVVSIVRSEQLVQPAIRKRKNNALSKS